MSWVGKCKGWGRGAPRGGGVSAESLSEGGEKTGAEGDCAVSRT